MRPSRFILLPVAIGLCLIVPVASAFAQSAPSSPSSFWQISAGPGWVAIRDIARTGRPVDASPVRWRSGGQAVEVLRRWGGNGRHGLDLTFARSAQFRSASPTGDLGARDADRYTDTEARYEYRRRMAPDVVVRHLDVTIGGQALAMFNTTRHVVPVDLVTTERVLGSGLALSLGAEWHPGRLSMAVAWANGMKFVRHRERNDVQDTPTSRWGGGWLTDLNASASWRVGARTALAVGYTRSGDALLSNHRTYARSRGAITVGVRHAR